jgi:hypothetical protein
MPSPALKLEPFASTTVLDPDGVLPTVVVVAVLPEAP